MWKRVEDSLPEDDRQEVLAYHSGPEWRNYNDFFTMEVLSFIKSDKKFITKNGCPMKVSYWQKLPKAPHTKEIGYDPGEFS